MSYFAAAVVRTSDAWTAAEVDLNGAADVEEVADRLRDVEPDAEVALLFVESDDIYLAVLRLDEGEDLRIFSSDSAFAEESRLGALLLGDIEVPTLEIDEVVAVTTPAPAAALPEADPSDAELSDADLSDVELSDADMSDADLPDPDLSDDDLADVDLADADLAGADLAESGLTGADPLDAQPAKAITDADADPIGDADLLADLGVPAKTLLRLCAQEGMLPSDVTAEVCQAIGCGDELEELREV